MTRDFGKNEARLAPEGPSANDQPAPASEPSPATQTRASGFRQMTLLEAEKEMLAEFAPFVGDSPRRAKRYLNLYLLLKTSLHLSVTPGRDARIAQRAVIALLVIVTGTGRPGTFFRTLDGISNATAPNLDKLLNALESNKPAHGLYQASDVIRKLIKVNQRDDVDHGSMMISALRHFGPTVRRYSF
jgi:hypothetical protein